MADAVEGLDDEAGGGEGGPEGGRIVARPDERVGVGGGPLHETLEPGPEATRHGEVRRHEGVAAVHRHEDEAPVGGEGAGDGPEGCPRIGEVLDGKDRGRDVDASVRDRERTGAEVGDEELVDVGTLVAWRMDVDADETPDPGPNRSEGRPLAAPGIEGDEGPSGGRRLDPVEGGLEPLAKEGAEAPLGRRAVSSVAVGSVPRVAHHAVAVAASTMPRDSSQRSASMAALQPSPAAVTAWR